MPSELCTLPSAQTLSRAGSHFRAAIRMHFGMLSGSWLAVCCTRAVCIPVFSSVIHTQPRHVAADILAVWLAAFTTDFAVLLFPRPAADFPLKRSPALESLVILAFTCAALITLSIRFGPYWPLHSIPARLAFVAAMFLFTFCVGLALSFPAGTLFPLACLGDTSRPAPRASALQC
jgi:hypothetical protein